ncbi:MAG: thioredoxin [Marinilabiliales bacterium]|nr:MAG: thioredoxin [Marinilabiliales bacterium]
MYKELITSEELDDTINDNIGAMVYFYSDKCAPCVSLRPKVKELVDEKFPKMTLAYVNSEKYPELPAKYNAFSSPTLVIFFEGKEYKRESKYISIPQLAETISRPYDMIFE